MLGSLYVKANGPLTWEVCVWWSRMTTSIMALLVFGEEKM